MEPIINALSNRGNWCWLLGHSPDAKPSCRTESNLVNIPSFKWCKHCSHNMGEL